MPVAHIKQTQIHYRDEGTGDATVVLLHAFPLNSSMWQPQIEALQGRHRIIAPDFRGMGRSADAPTANTMEILAEDVAALLRHLSIERASVVGLSMGGYVAFELYRRAPKLFEALILCDTKAGADNEQGRANRETFAENAEQKGMRWVADEMLPKLLAKADDTKTADLVQSLILANKPAGVAACQRGMAQRLDSEATLAKIACPTLILVGEHDALTPPAESLRMAGSIPGATFYNVPRAGHLSNLENADDFNESLEEFLHALPSRAREF